MISLYAGKTWLINSCHRHEAQADGMLRMIFAVSEASAIASRAVRMTPERRVRINNLPPKYDLTYVRR